MTISDLATCNLQLGMYAVKHFDRTSHVDGAFVTLLRAITPESKADLSYQRKKEEYDAKETPTLPKLTLDGSCVAKLQGSLQVTWRIPQHQRCPTLLHHLKHLTNQANP